MNRIRVLVVEDSVTIRRRMAAVLAADPELKVVGEAGDGRAGFELCRELRPDALTLDMALPVMSGLAATEAIMAYCPTPILIVSGSTNRGEVFHTYDALAAGAVDVLEKPRGDEMDGAWERSLIAAVKMVARVAVITHVQGKLTGQGGGERRQPGAGQAAAAAAAAGGYRVVGMGASTGGPAACAALLAALPESFPLPLLLVIHTSPAFGVLLADWLCSQSALPVRLARDGEPLPAPGPRQGVVLLAPPNRHLEVRQGRLQVGAGAERHSCRPSVDVLFESLAAELGPGAIGCLLTGMGRDGAAGLMEMRRSGGWTIAQDEASAVVFGMPREAIRLGAARQVLGLSRIAPHLTELAAAEGPA